MTKEYVQNQKKNKLGENKFKSSRVRDNDSA